MDERRTARVSEAVREELAELIAFELDDPRLLGAEVTDANVSPDGRHARVHISIRGEVKAQDAALAALDHATNYLRRELASRLLLRTVPELHFDLNKNPDVDSRIDLLLKRARKSRREA
jgi:ribosome-binding factor A